MSQEVASCVPEPWYHWYRFPVVPHLRTRKENEHNTASFSFSWLVFRVWSMDSVEIKAEVSLDDQNLVVRGMIPYLIFGVWIPVFPQSFMQKLWRKSPRMRQWAREAKEERKRRRERIA